MPALLALICHLTNENLILGRITFFNQTDFRRHCRLSSIASAEIVSANGTKNGEIKKQKIKIFCCEGYLASGCAVMLKYFL